jgi:hypothetical protein
MEYENNLRTRIFTYGLALFSALGLGCATGKNMLEEKQMCGMKGELYRWGEVLDVTLFDHNCDGVLDYGYSKLPGSEFAKYYWADDNDNGNIDNHEEYIDLIQDGWNENEFSFCMLQKPLRGNNNNIYVFEAYDIGCKNSFDGGVIRRVQKLYPFLYLDNKNGNALFEKDEVLMDLEEDGRNGNETILIDDDEVEKIPLEEQPSVPALQRSLERQLS